MGVCTYQMLCKLEVACWRLAIAICVMACRLEWEGKKMILFLLSVKKGESILIYAFSTKKNFKLNLFCISNARYTYHSIKVYLSIEKFSIIITKNRLKWKTLKFQQSKVLRSSTVRCARTDKLDKCCDPNLQNECRTVYYAGTHLGTDESSWRTQGNDSFGH